MIRVRECSLPKRRQAGRGSSQALKWGSTERIRNTTRNVVGVRLMVMRTKLRGGRPNKRVRDIEKLKVIRARIGQAENRGRARWKQRRRGRAVESGLLSGRGDQADWRFIVGKGSSKEVLKISEVWVVGSMREINVVKE